MAEAVQLLADPERDPGPEPEFPLATSRRRTVLSTIGSYALTVLALVSLNFFLPRALPGDPISILVAGAEGGRPLDEATRSGVLRYYGLDRPLLSQYGHYLGDLAQGDLGTSIRYRRQVSEIVLDRLPWTLLLMGSSVFFATVIGLVAGVHSGWRRGRSLDRGLLALFAGLRNMPAYLLASLALVVFSVKLGWFPLGGAVTPFSGSHGLLQRLADIGHHLVLPASVMAVQFAAGQYLVMRSGVVSELGSDYLLLGRAKGLSEHILKYRYAARNALLPVVSLTALQMSLAMTAGIFVETIFAYPGLGRLVFDATQARDYPLLQGCFLVLSLTVLSLNFVADLLYTRLDPRAGT